MRENGYHGTTVRRIVARAGLTMPALYYHYGNKEGVLVALLDLGMDDLLGHLRDGLAQAGHDPADRLRAFVFAVTGHVTRRQDLAILHREYRFLSDGARAGYVARRDEVDAMLVDIIEDGVVDGRFTVRDTRFGARVILGMVQGATDWYRPDGPDTPETIADRFVEAALRVLGAEGGGREQ
ncbi:TetR/AcrR family transcriptional regulator [Tsukamurella soli]|uniref:TetR/AcrR family transcriptional regulator n=1 Tax=Tsukamurella soli TaxID=644556 RepID=A0ABP8JMM7_9ACTN